MGMGISLRILPVGEIHSDCLFTIKGVSRQGFMLHLQLIVLHSCPLPTFYIFTQGFVKVF